jgi:indolepyruvate ferredoxin oxidoreductase alpha subunit
MQKLLLLGNEAVARGAIDGGLSGIYAYPGTPSTEIMEYIQKSKEAVERSIQREWSTNEKTAMEAALGMAYAGKRSMVCMKHVGLNVAADPFINAAITGVNGGLIVAVADDPSMHSSQNEQDSRFYGKFAKIPILEPSNQQEAYYMAYKGFELSEKYKIPVLLRLTTRLSHSRTGVKRLPVKKQNDLVLPEDPKQFVLLPSIARIRFKQLLSNQSNFHEESEISEFNQFFDGQDKSLGIIACGIGYNYLMENYPDRTVNHPVLKLSQFPLPRNLINKITSECQEILVLEEGFPFVEEMLKCFQEKVAPVKGRLSGDIPRDGELTPDIVGKALGIEQKRSISVPEIVKERPPSMCKGCGHIDVFNALIEALGDKLEGRIFSDIGCYTLAALPPFNAINSCVNMGASVTMAVGAADAGLFPSVAVIGDSTFTHSGITGLLDAVIKNSPITLIISDNYATGMTGGQKSSATGRLFSICEGIGVEPNHLRKIEPLKKYHNENVEVLRNEFDYRGVSVILAERECIQVAAKRHRMKR